MSKKGGWPWCNECRSYHARGNPTCKKIIAQKMAKPIDPRFTIMGQYEWWRRNALREDEIPIGSRQDNEMKKAFLSGMAAAGMALIEGAVALPEELAASLPQRWVGEYDAFITKQVALHKISNQNEKGN